MSTSLSRLFAIRRPQRSAGEIPHGTFSGYTYHRCRCAKCRLKMARHKHPSEIDGRLKPITHGTITGYNTRKCRCEKCRAAIATYKRERYAALRAGKIISGDCA